MRKNNFRFSKNWKGVARDLNVSLENRTQFSPALNAYINQDYSDALEECIDYWIRNGKEPNWEKLLDVISSYERNTANKIRESLGLPVKQGNIIH